MAEGGGRLAQALGSLEFPAMDRIEKFLRDLIHAFNVLGQLTFYGLWLYLFVMAWVDSGFLVALVIFIVGSFFIPVVNATFPLATPGQVRHK